MRSRIFIATAEPKPAPHSRYMHASNVFYMRLAVEGRILLAALLLLLLSPPPPLPPQRRVVKMSFKYCAPQRIMHIYFARGEWKNSRWNWVPQPAIPHILTISYYINNNNFVLPLVYGYCLFC